MTPANNADRRNLMTDGWEVLQEAIPRGESKAIAAFFQITQDAVNRWRREPESDEGAGTGNRSPLDQVLILINAVYARNPEGADLIVARIRSELASLKNKHEQRYQPTPKEMERRLRQIGDEIDSLADAIPGRDT